MDYIKEKTIICRDYIEVDVIPSTGNKPRSRIKKKAMSTPKQKNLNEKNARRHFIQLMNANFDKQDFHLTLTLDDEHHTDDLKKAEHIITNYFKRLKRRQKKVSNAPIKYMLVIQVGTVRTHFHLVLSCALSRDDIENAWGLGYANCDRLKPDEYGLEALSRYLAKHTGGNKRWSSSQNLKKPVLVEKVMSVRGVYSQKKMQLNCMDRDFWEKRFKGYVFTECKAEFNEITGWSYYTKMRKLI